jgi:hypothetical protein
MTSADAGSRREQVAPKIVSEVHELHRRTVEVARRAGGRRGRRNRRERREAMEAESDLLRVLGFESYEAFEACAARANEGDGDAGITGAAPPTLSLVDDASSGTEVDARETEAALLRVLRAGATAPSVTRRDAPSDDELRTRVALFEEELAETRFELLTLRDRVREFLREAADAEAAQDEPVDDAVPAAASALIQVAAELRGLCALLREERAGIAALGADARLEAERLLDGARVDAQRLCDEAAAQARAVLDQASADAVALTRNAISTVDGLRRLADEAGATPGLHPDPST